MKTGVVPVSLLLALAVASSHAADLLPHQNRELTIEERIQDLLPRMTLEEKCAPLNLWPNLAELLKHESIEDDVAITLNTAWPTPILPLSKTFRSGESHWPQCGCAAS